MLSTSQVLTYVKTKLGAPFLPIEYDDEQIISWVRKNSLISFSRYLPREASFPLNMDDPSVQTNIPNVYLLKEPNGIPIIDIQRVDFPFNDMVIMGHPIIPLLSSNSRGVIDYMVQTQKFGDAYKNSMFKNIYEFLKPDKIRIMPMNARSGGATCTIEYESFHLNDFSSIWVEFQEMFLDLAWADVAINLSLIRKQFGPVKSNFGEIQLGGDELYQRAKETRDKIIEYLESANPSILVDIY